MKKLMISLCLSLALIITNVSPIFSQEVGKAILQKVASPVQTSIGEKLAWGAVGGAGIGLLNLVTITSTMLILFRDYLKQVPVKERILEFIKNPSRDTKSHVLNGLVSGFLGGIISASVPKDKRIYPIFATVIYTILSNAFIIKQAREKAYAPWYSYKS